MNSNQMHKDDNYEHQQGQMLMNLLNGYVTYVATYNKQIAYMFLVM